MTAFVFRPPTTPSHPIEGSDQRFPLSRVFCLGRNYHWADAAAEPGPFPAFFMKPSTAVIPASGELAFPAQTDEFCHEVELVVAIGKAGWRIAEQHALEHVWGYAVGLDLTRRDWQMRAKAAGQPWEAAKAFDESAPVTPIVPADRLGHPASGAVWLSVNGSERQRSALEHQIWAVAQVISRLSEQVRLLPGDLIMTGTPAGVDTLQPGDLVQAGIDGIAQLSMQVGARPSID